jgi:hypothetical protein
MSDYLQVNNISRINPYLIDSCKTKNSCYIFAGVLLGGEGGIRTREPFQVTHIPGVRARPTTRPLHFF